jgi:hypothetical protein
MERNPGAEDDSHGEDRRVPPESDRDGHAGHDGHDDRDKGVREERGEHGREEPHGRGEDDDGQAPLPLDEKAAWEQIVASYGDHPKAEEMASGPEGSGDARTGTATRPAPGSGPGGESEGDEGSTSVRSFTVYSAGSGPRDWSLPSPDDESGTGSDEDDEGHFVPPEPPPLPQSDTTAKFAWLAVLGGPLLLIFAILLQVELTWWIATLGVGGFLGGFATLVARMRDGRDEDDWDDPGRGAVV